MVRTIEFSDGGTVEMEDSGSLYFRYESGTVAYILNPNEVGELVAFLTTAKDETDLSTATVLTLEEADDDLFKREDGIWESLANGEVYTEAQLRKRYPELDYTYTVRR